MRVAIVTQDFPPEIGGIQTYCYEIGKRLSNICADFYLIAPDKPGAGEVDGSLDFDVLRIKTRNTLLGWVGIPKALAWLEKRPVDVLFHAQWHTLPIARRARSSGLLRHVAVAAHGREFFFNPYDNIPLLGKAYERHKRNLLTVPDLFLPVSHFNSRAVGEHGVPAEKRVVINNGTNPDEYYPMDQEAMKEKYGYQGRRVVLTMARLVERKGLDNVLEAIALLKTSHPDIIYVIGGSGAHEGKLRRRVATLGLKGHVAFEGWVKGDKIREFYNMSDVFVTTPLSRMPVEGFGIVFLEANACGKAVIGSNAGGIPDAIVDGKTGLLVEDENPKALAEAISEIIDNPGRAKEMGGFGRERVIREANWDVVTRRIFDLFTELKDGRR